MGNILLAIYLILVGLNVLVGLRIPGWVTGLLAVVAGAVLLLERFGVLKR